MGKRDDTARRLETAFLELYATRPLDQLTVRELAQRAGLSRGTFYLYHDDLDGLLTAIEDDQLARIRELNTANRRFYLSPEVSGLKRFYLPTLEHIQDNMGVFRVLLGPHARPRFREEFQALMRANIQSKYKLRPGADRADWDAAKSYVIDLLVSGNIAIIAHWVTSGSPDTAQDIADLFGEIIAHLPYAALKR